MPPVVRQPHLAPQILFVDGLSGTGKTMIAPILSSFDRVEVHRIEQIYEYVSILWNMGRMEDDAAIWFLRTYTDQTCYHAMIGREVNFRWKDLSGVLGNPGGRRYLKRLLQPEGDAIIDTISAQQPVIQLITHQILTPMVFKALGNRVKIIEMVRNPLYLIPHWYSYIDRIGTNPRDLYVCFDYDGQSLPWFAEGWEEKYINSNKMDRVIYLIERLSAIEHENLNALDEETNKQVLIIPFEQFVLEPDPYIDSIGKLIGSKVTSLTKKTLRKEKVPRKMVTAGRDLPIYRRYAWRPAAQQKSESGQSADDNDFNERWAEVAEEASPEGIKVLEKMCAAYSNLYPSRFNLQ